MSVDHCVSDAIAARPCVADARRIYWVAPILGGNGNDRFRRSRSFACRGLRICADKFGLDWYGRRAIRSASAIRAIDGGMVVGRVRATCNDRKISLCTRIVRSKNRAMPAWLFPAGWKLRVQSNHRLMHYARARRTTNICRSRSACRMGAIATMEEHRRCSARTSSGQGNSHNCRTRKATIWSSARHTSRRRRRLESLEREACAALEIAAGFVKETIVLVRQAWAALARACR